MRGAIVLAALMVAGCGSSSAKTEGIAPEPGARDDAGNTVLPDGGVGRSDGGAVPPGVDPIETSGTRLKVKTMSGADGSRIAMGLHDTQLDADCGFVTASDGLTRCLPLSGATPSSPTYFADGACTKRLAVVLKNCSIAVPFSYTADAVAPACAVPRYHVFRFGPAHATTIYSGSPCASIGGSEPAQRAAYDFYSLSDEMPASTFVQGAAGLQ